MIVAGWVVLIVLSALMAYITATLVKWAADAKDRAQAAVVLFLLAMMVEMLAGALVYYLHPSESSAVAGLWLAGGAMSVSVFPLFLVLAGSIRSGPPSATSPRVSTPPGPGFLFGVVALVLANELLMGVVFSLAAGTPTLAEGTATLASTVVAAVNSPWFLFTMAAEMAMTAYLLRDRLARPVIVLIGMQAAVMALAPTAIADPGWVTTSVIAGSAAMILFVIYALEHLHRRPQIERSVSHYLLAVLGAYALMMAGLYLWMRYGWADLFAASIVAEMVAYFAYVVRPSSFGTEERVVWTARAPWAFALLSLIFVAELFMGAAIDLVTSPGLLAPESIGLLPLSGSGATQLGHALSNGFWFFAAVTASTGFLLMMGVEMGALVVFKMRETRNFENRLRMGLMVGCYAAFVVFYPSEYFAVVFPHAPEPTQVPLLGWSMGIGSAPIAAGVFVAILMTYVLTGVLVVLFGRRSICAVFCMAAVMYQGNAISEMKAFNRSSRIGRKYLSSRLSGLYQATTGVVMASLAVASVTSYLDSIGTLKVLIAGTDPTVFLYAAYFSVLWYLLFVAIPFVGNYNCVTMGWCYTGTIAQAFQKVSFFKLKVRSRQTCWECTTLDCAKGCPVGLVDMPGHFRQQGEFRSTKCCGVGECVEACPYDNLYVADVRHWIRRRLGRPETPARRTTTMPKRAPASIVPRPGIELLPRDATPLPMFSPTPRPRADR